MLIAGTLASRNGSQRSRHQLVLFLKHGAQIEQNAAFFDASNDRRLAGS
jgi:hypothetical protein